MPLILSTTSPVTLGEAKAHLRIDGTHDDALIGRQLIAATQYVEGELRRPFSDFDPVPEILKAAVLLVCGTLYEQREHIITGTIVSQLGDTLQRIIQQFHAPEVV